MRTLNLFVIAVSFALFCACSTDHASNGTGSNAGETEMAITFKTPSDLPLVSAKVRVWNIGSDSLSVEDSLVANEKGAVAFDSSLSGWKLVEANSGDTLSVMKLVNFADSLPKALVATFPETLKGKILKTGAPLSGAIVRILGKSSVTAADGSFEVPGLPAGTHFVFVYVAGKASTQTFQMQTSNSTNVAEISDTAYTLIEDFENWNMHTLLGKAWGRGWWFVGSDSALGGKSFVSPGFSDTANTIITAGAYSGKSLYATLNIDSSFTGGKFALVGFTLGGDFDEAVDNYRFDLTSLVSVSFMAKGSGTVNLQMMRRDSTGAKEYHKVPFNLSSVWSKYEIEAFQFNAEMTDVNAFNFMADDSTAEIYLDDIRFVGIAPVDWMILGTK